MKEIKVFGGENNQEEEINENILKRKSHEI